MLGRGLLGGSLLRGIIELVGGLHDNVDDGHGGRIARL